jgi:hypothetical protein
MYTEYVARRKPLRPAQTHSEEAQTETHQGKSAAQHSDVNDERFGTGGGLSCGLPRHLGGYGGGNRPYG